MARRTWTKQEEWIVSLLLEGQADFLQALARQVKPPFCQRVIRRNPRSWRKADRTELNEYHWDLVFDESLLGQYSLGPDVEMHIDDLHVTEKHLGERLQIIAQISNGLLTRIVARAPRPVRWPRKLQIDDWCYILQTPEGPWRSKRRADLDRLSRRQSRGEEDDGAIPMAIPISAQADPPTPDPESEDPDVHQIARAIAEDPSHQQFERVLREVAGPPADSDEPAESEPQAEPQPVPEPQPEAAEEPPSRSDEDWMEGLADEDDEPDQTETPQDSPIRQELAGDEGLAEEEEDDDQPQAPQSLAADWVRQFLAESFDAGQGVHLKPPAGPKQLAQLSEAFGGDLPGDLADWLRCGNGGRIWNQSLLSCEEIAVLEGEEQEDHLVPFALDDAGGGWALDTSRRQADSCVVVRIGRRAEGGPEVESFSAWLRIIQQRAATRLG